jgi:hypothetical protein
MKRSGRRVQSRLLEGQSALECDLPALSTLQALLSSVNASTITPSDLFHAGPFDREGIDFSETICRDLPSRKDPNIEPLHVGSRPSK